MMAKTADAPYSLFPFFASPYFLDKNQKNVIQKESTALMFINVVVVDSV
jgi:hypothetical protein